MKLDTLERLLSALHIELEKFFRFVRSLDESIGAQRRARVSREESELEEAFKNLHLAIDKLQQVVERSLRPGAAPAPKAAVEAAGTGGPRLTRSLGLVLGGAVAAATLASALVAEPGSSSSEPTPGTLRVVWQQELPPYPSGPALDIRWASDHSVYLSWVKEGVTETALDGKFTRLRMLVTDPDRWMRDFEFLGASPDFVVASGRSRIMMLRPTPPSHPGGLVAITKAPISIVEDLDVFGKRLLILGNPEWSESPAPSIAWLGPVSEHPRKDLEPLPLYDVAGARSPSLINCDELLLGAARFLPDGSMLVVPGFQPGAHHFSSAGRLLRTWDTVALGIDAVDCAHMSGDQTLLFGRSQQARFDFINQHRVLEDILPLAAGPGLLIRFVADGKVHWELKVLQSGPRVLTYQVPLTGNLPFDRLRGDARGGRIVLLRGAHGFAKWGPPFPVNLVAVAELTP